MEKLHSECQIINQKLLEVKNEKPVLCFYFFCCLPITFLEGHKVASYFS